jgi:hypothetical protein
MSHQQTKHELLLCKLEQRLVGERYCVQIRNRYLVVAANFLRFLDRRRIRIEATGPPVHASRKRSMLAPNVFDSIHRLTCD